MPVRIADFGLRIKNAGAREDRMTSCFGQQGPKVSPGTRLSMVIVCIAVLAASTAGSAAAADDPVTRAMKLYEKRHYDEAAGVLRAGVAIDPARRGAADLALGMIYFKNAQLHQELYRSAVLVSQDYLKKLSAAQGKDRSRFVDLYLGEALIEAGKPGVAAIYLEKFSGTAGVEPKYQAIARIGLGLCYYRNNETRKAMDLWADINSTDPEVRMELAAAYSKAGVKDKNAEATVDELMAAARKTGKPFTERTVKNVLAVYAQAGRAEKGLDALRRADLKASSFQETLGKSKVITFYDLSLLGDMAELYGRAGIMHLERAASDGKTKDAAEFYLGQAQALFGSVDQASKVAASFLASSQMPQQYKDRMRVWQAAGQYQRNHKAEAAAVWDELSLKQPGDPDLLAELLFTCARLKIDCPKIVQKASAAAEAGEGKKFANLNVAIGTYHLGRLDRAKGVAFLEAGRDKSNKNKIESNDPGMLVNLAEAYYRNKAFSEALEIYFEMSKQFPEVRQIQDAMQGVYAVEHKSAGDVKIN